MSCHRESHVNDRLYFSYFSRLDVPEDSLDPNRLRYHCNQPQCRPVPSLVSSSLLSRDRKQRKRTLQNGLRKNFLTLGLLKGPVSLVNLHGWTRDSYSLRFVHYTTPYTVSQSLQNPHNVLISSVLTTAESVCRHGRVGLNLYM